MGSAGNGSATVTLPAVDPNALSTVRGRCNGFGFCGLSVTVTDSIGGLLQSQSYTLYLHVKYSYDTRLSGLEFTSTSGAALTSGCPLTPWSSSNSVLPTCASSATFDGRYSVHAMEVEQDTEALFVKATFSSAQAVVRFCGYDDLSATLGVDFAPNPNCPSVFTRLANGVVATGVGSLVPGSSSIYSASTSSTQGFPDSSIGDQSPERLLPGQINTVVISARSEAYKQAVLLGDATLVPGAVATYYVYVFRRLKFSDNQLGAIALTSPAIDYVNGSMSPSQMAIQLEGALKPSFSPSVLAYNISVGYNVSSVIVQPIQRSVNDPCGIYSGSASGIYSITCAAALTIINAFKPASKTLVDYKDLIPYNLSFALFNPKAVARVYVNGGPAILSGGQSQALSLMVGTNTISVGVEAEGATSNNTYTLTVTRHDASTDSSVPGAPSPPPPVVSSDLAAMLAINASWYAHEI